VTVEGERAVLTEKGEKSPPLPLEVTAFTFNDKPMTIAPVKKEGKIFVPLKSFCEQLGASVLYNKDTDILDITRKKNFSTGEIQKSLDAMKARREAFRKKWGDITTFRYVVIGSSSAEGAGANPQTKGFAWLISESLQRLFPQVEMTNLGQGGKKSTAFLQNGTIQKAVMQKPHLIVILPLQDYGLQEAEFRANWDKIFKMLRTGSDAIIVYGKFHRKESPYDQTLNAIIEELAVPYDVVTVDIPCPFDSDPSTKASDGIHPNNKGHQVYADLFWQAISTLF
jgi:lysophospholipase L1-like esterase